MTPIKSRLEALGRQRDLLREHAQWLDEEIAAERARLQSTTDLSVASGEVVGESQAPPAAEILPVPIEPDVKGLHTEVQRGCLLYFLIAALLFGAVVGFIYWKY